MRVEFVNPATVTGMDDEGYFVANVEGRVAFAAEGTPHRTLA